MLALIVRNSKKVLCTWNIARMVQCVWSRNSSKECFSLVQPHTQDKGRADVVYLGVNDITILCVACKPQMAKLAVKKRCPD